MRIMDSLQFCKLAGITKPTMHSWLNEGLLERKMLNGKALYFTDKDLKKVPKIKKQMKIRKHTRTTNAKKKS